MRHKAEDVQKKHHDVIALIKDISKMPNPKVSPKLFYELEKLKKQN